MKKLCLIGIVTAFAAASAHADMVMHTPQPTTITGNQTGYGVGLEFSVVTPGGIDVKSLGVFDSGDDGVIANNLWTYIFDSSGNTVASMEFTPSNSGALVSNYLWKGTPVHLAPGDYKIASYGFTGSDSEHNSNVSGGIASEPTFNGSPAVEFDNSFWTDPGALPGTVPMNSYLNNRDYFDAPNMDFSVTTVPVPAAFLLAMLGLGTAGLKLRKRV